jgi:predicted Zn finger-like uncharacterized protein
MPIATACPNCGKDYRLADDMGGKNVKCKNCATVFLVQPVARNVPVPPPSNKSATTAEPGAPLARRAWPRRDEDDVADVLPTGEDERVEWNRPVRRRERRAVPKSSGLMWVLIAGGVLAFFLLLGCTGIVSWYLTRSSGIAIDEAAFDKLKGDMTEGEVAAVIGPPTRRTAFKNTPAGNGAFGFKTPEMTTCEWDRGGNSITVMFLDGKAAWLTGTFRGANGTTDIRSKSGASPFEQVPNFQFPANPVVPRGGGIQQGGGPSKMTNTGVFMLGPAHTKSDIEFFTRDDPPTEKDLNPGAAPNGQAASECWVWKNAPGYLKIWFDAKGKIIDKECKDLPG